ncbi:MAG: 50S ribosomal protein L14e [archaeon]
MIVGQVCIKKKGHDAGRECVIIELKEKENRALVTGPKAVTGVRRRYVNLAHLTPTQKALQIKANASDSEIAALLGRKITEHPKKETPVKTEEKKEAHPKKAEAKPKAKPKAKHKAKKK